MKKSWKEWSISENEIKIFEKCCRWLLLMYQRILPPGILMRSRKLFSLDSEIFCPITSQLIFFNY